MTQKTEVATFHKLMQLKPALFCFTLHAN